MSELPAQPATEPSSRPALPSPIRVASPFSSTQTAASTHATQETITTISAPTTSNQIIYPLRSPTSPRSTPRSPRGEQSNALAPAQSESPLTEDSSRKPKLPCPNKLAQEKPLPPRIIQISPQDFNSFREVLEEYKLRNLLLVSESKLTTREDIIAHFK